MRTAPWKSAFSVFFRTLYVWLFFFVLYGYAVPIYTHSFIHCYRKYHAIHLLSLQKTGKIESTCHLVCFSMCACTTSPAPTQPSAQHSSVMESCCILSSTAGMIRNASRHLRRLDITRVCWGSLTALSSTNQVHVSIKNRPCCAVYEKYFIPFWFVQLHRLKTALCSLQIILYVRPHCMHSTDTAYYYRCHM